MTGSDLTDAELAGIAGFLLGAGLETTANMLALGTFAMLGNPASSPHSATIPASWTGLSRNCCGT